MPILQIRIDNRMIHGILRFWVAKHSIDHIIIANDRTADDPIQVRLLQRAAPWVEQLSVLSTVDTVRYCGGEGPEENVLVIAKFPEDAYWLLWNAIGLGITVNLALQDYVRGAEKVAEWVWLTAQGRAWMHGLSEFAGRIVSQRLVSDPEQEIIV